MNAHHDVVEFTLPEAVGGTQWVCLLDTNHVEADELAEFDFGHTYEVTGHSLLLFILRPNRTKGAQLTPSAHSNMWFSHPKRHP
jgi:glycogen operon protein